MADLGERRMCLDMPRIGIVAGEASGDLYGAKLAYVLKLKLPCLELEGIGSRQMREAGVNLLEDASQWGAMGITESLKVAPRIYSVLKRLERRWLASPPDLLICIDFGAFNVPLCKWAKAKGIKTLYYMPPGAWRKTKQGSDLPKIADRIATPFDWSFEMLKQMGGEVEWVGHPLLDFACPTIEKKEFFSRHEIAEDATLVGFFPGSRLHELNHHLPVLARVAELLEQRGHSALYLAALAPTISSEVAEQIWKRHTLLPIRFISGQNYEIMAYSRALVMSSGTATLEAAIQGTPMVVIYRGSFLMNIEYRIRKPKFDYISLPNILAEAPLAPELIQEAATPKRIADELIPLLGESSCRCKQIQGFENVRARLGSKGATERTAEIAVQLLKS